MKVQVYKREMLSRTKVVNNILRIWDMTTEEERTDWYQDASNCIVNNFEEDYNYYVIPNGFDLLRRVDSVIEEIDFCESKDLVFHSDWAWLMKVVEKIHTLGGHVSMSFPHVFLHYPKTYKSCTMYNDDSTSNITKVFQACYEFIIWHNKENQLS